MITHLNPEWQVYVPLWDCRTPMPLREALEISIQRDFIIITGSVIRNNIILRDAYRDMGPEAFTKELLDLVHNNDEFVGYMEIFNRRLAREGGLAYYDIQVYDKDELLTFFGVTVQGLKGVQQRVECSLNSEYGGTPDRITPEVSDIHVGRVWENYPRFDSSDWLDDRTFDNYLIRNHPVTSQEISNVAAILAPNNANRLNEYIPADCLPLVYYEGEGEFIYVASEKSNTP